MIFCQKNAIWGEYSYVKHTLFILYLEENHTLFGEKLYFILKFCNGNTASDIVHYAHSDLSRITMELCEIPVLFTGR